MRDKSYETKKIYIVLRRERKAMRDKSYETKKIYIVEDETQRIRERA